MALVFLEVARYGLDVSARGMKLGADTIKAGISRLLLYGSYSSVLSRNNYFLTKSAFANEYWKFIWSV
jgi:hypothetical protein